MPCPRCTAALLSKTETKASLYTSRSKAKIQADAQMSIESKYNDAIAQESLEWIKKLTGEPADTAGNERNFHNVLKNGVLLCKLVNIIHAGSVEEVNQSTMACKCLDNINTFLEAAKLLGVPSQDTFKAIDLWEKRNLHSVISCLQSLDLINRKSTNYCNTLPK